MIFDVFNLLSSALRNYKNFIISVMTNAAIKLVLVNYLILKNNIKVEHYERANLQLPQQFL